MKNCAANNGCINKKNNTEIDNAKDIDVVISMYNLIEYSDNCLKTSGSLWQYCRNESFLKRVGTIISFATTTFKQKLTGQAAAGAKKDVEIVALKYLYNFWRNLEMTLINCEINLILTLSEKCVTSFGTVVNQSATFEMTDTKLYVPLVTLATLQRSRR